MVVNKISFRIIRWQRLEPGAVVPTVQITGRWVVTYNVETLLKETIAQNAKENHTI